MNYILLYNIVIKYPNTDPTPEEALFFRDLTAIGMQVDQLQTLFFELSDVVLNDAQERNWQAVVSDGASGHFVAHYLHRLLAARATIQGKPQPQFIEYANSKRIRAPEHYRAVRDSIASLQIGCVLMATESVSTGSGVIRLAQTFERANVQTDIAVLGSSLAASGLRSRLLRDQADRRIYHPALPNQAQLNTSLLTEGAGLTTVSGTIHPIPNPDARSAVVDHAHAMFEMLADQYIALRMPH